MEAVLKTFREAAVYTNFDMHPELLVTRPVLSVSSIYALCVCPLSYQWLSLLNAEMVNDFVEFVPCDCQLFVGNHTCPDVVSSQDEHTVSKCVYVRLYVQDAVSLVKNGMRLRL